MFPFPQIPFLTLLSEGAVYLTDSSTLVVADVHLGKSATFRARGLPVPEGDTARDFQRLLELRKKCGAARLVIAGDLFHASSGITPELETALAEFLTELAVPVTLVIGNHDAKISSLPSGLHCVPSFPVAAEISVVHDPAHGIGEIFHICGHLHPTVKFRDGKRTSLRMPCFLFRANTLILPAFGSFTGGALMTPLPEDRVFVSLRDTVVELPTEIF